MQTLHDLMDESELDSLTPADIDVEISSADRRRRDLEENIRREAEERQRRKRELLIREREYEKVQLMNNTTCINYLKGIGICHICRR